MRERRGIGNRGRKKGKDEERMGQSEQGKKKKRKG